MAITLPIAVDEKPVGTCFVAGKINNKLAFLTTLHHLGNGINYKIGLPAHMGDVSKAQLYPIQSVSSIDVELVYVDPVNDLAVLVSTTETISAPIPRFLQNSNEIKIGETVIILGYPYLNLGSLLETAEICHISALGKRIFMNPVVVDEFIVSHQTYMGSSGSPVVRKSDGVVCGIVRGCLAPPETISIGNIPIGSDSNITYVTSSSIFESILKEAEEEINE